MHSENIHYQYQNNQLAEVICQLRFPDILSISAEPPAAFQSLIRSDFPRYAVHMQPSVPGNPEGPKQSNSANYQFTSVDGTWRVNLTNKFVSLSTSGYTNWEAFARRLDLPLAALIKVYQPAYFERIGLRYLNFFSRESLGLENTPFSDMFQAPYLGILANNDISEASVTRSSVDAERTISGGCKVKIHAGPGLIKRNGQANKEIHFIFDQDLYMPGNVQVNYAAGALQTLHTQAYPIFRGAITDLTHNAMDPLPKDR